MHNSPGCDASGVSQTPAWVVFGQRVAYLPAADALVLADLHVGRGSASGERRDILARLRGHLDRFEPARVVVAGDLLHATGSLPAGVAETVGAVVGAIEDSAAGLRVVRGNRDGMLAAVGVSATDSVRLDDGTVVCHGHEEPAADGDRYVVGHQHPAVTISGGQRRPCFLYGPGQYDSADVLVVPAFTRLAAGTPVGTLGDGTAVSPLLAPPAGYRPIVVSNGETLGFPALGDLDGLLVGARGYET